MHARLLLSDGTVYTGVSLGAINDAVGEVVFNTAMTGYQEILTDPSYYGQLITMTYPQIGNYGINSLDVESRKIFASGFIIREYSSVYSHWQAEMSLDEYLKFYGCAGIAEIDTRALTRRLRDFGAQMGMISASNTPNEVLLNQLRSHPTLVGRDIVKEVMNDKQYDWDSADAGSSQNEKKQYKVAVYDFGVKYSILRQLSRVGCAVRVFPGTTLPEDILAYNPDGLFLSNGPGDPEPVEYAVKSVRTLLGRLPIFGICLGHQILGLAIGGRTSKLKFGHHGANHPVKNLITGAIEITSQNHGFIVDRDSLPDKMVDITHINLNDGTVEGMRHRSFPAFSVQYHPEASPGPHDSRYLFEQFITDMKNYYV
jgi:carbamoyl-phosphate synthase small subunit